MNYMKNYIVQREINGETFEYPLTIVLREGQSDDLEVLAKEGYLAKFVIKHFKKISQLLVNDKLYAAYKSLFYVLGTRLPFEEASYKSYLMYEILIDNLELMNNERVLLNNALELFYMSDKYSLNDLLDICLILDLILDIKESRVIQYEEGLKKIEANLKGINFTINQQYLDDEVQLTDLVIKYFISVKNGDNRVRK